MTTPATPRRRGSFKDHAPPSGDHAKGQLDGLRWTGTSKIHDRAGRRAAMKKTWAKITRQARADAVLLAKLKKEKD